jgi:predicted cupin superfamily sugar epimerase
MQRQGYRAPMFPVIWEVSALLGSSMAPGFEYEDYETGERQELIARYPQFSQLITSLTR